MRRNVLKSLLALVAWPFTKRTETPLDKIGNFLQRKKMWISKTHCVTITDEYGGRRMQITIDCLPKSD